MKKVKKAIIPAAGMGTRFLPATKAMPKEMLPIVDRPTIEYIVEMTVQHSLSKYSRCGKIHLLLSLNGRQCFVEQYD